MLCSKPNHHRPLGLVQDDHGLTPLALALITGSHEAAARLASQGADVRAADNQGVAPAHRAAGHGDLNALELLSGSGADFEIQSGAGTPLHWAAGEVMDHTVKRLRVTARHGHMRSENAGSSKRRKCEEVKHDSEAK